MVACDPTIHTIEQVRQRKWSQVGPRDPMGLKDSREHICHELSALLGIRDSAVSSGQLEVDFASDQVGDRDEIAQ
jgi:hypothetical protein